MSLHNLISIILFRNNTQKPRSITNEYHQTFIVKGINRYCKCKQIFYDDNTIRNEKIVDTSETIPKSVKIEVGPPLPKKMTNGSDRHEQQQGNKQNDAKYIIIKQCQNQWIRKQLPEVVTKQKHKRKRKYIQQRLPRVRGHSKKSEKK